MTIKNARKHQAALSLSFACQFSRQVEYRWVGELPRAFRTAELVDSSTLPMLAADIGFAPRIEPVERRATQLRMSLCLTSPMGTLLQAGSTSSRRVHSITTIDDGFRWVGLSIQIEPDSATMTRLLGGSRYIPSGLRDA